MKNFLLFVIIIVIIAVVGFLTYQALGKKEQAAPEAKITMPEALSLQNKKIAMVIAPNFRDEEYFTPKAVLQEAGAEITTISEQAGQIIGADGGEAGADLGAGEASAENFDAVIFIGGPGMAQRLDNSAFQKLAQTAAGKNKVLGAICIAPALLANAGLLRDKKATVWSSPLDKSAIKILEQAGANYQNEPVVADGKIITANGPAAAEEFAEALIKIIK